MASHMSVLAVGSAGQVSLIIQLMVVQDSQQQESISGAQVLLSRTRNFARLKGDDVDSKATETVRMWPFIQSTTVVFGIS